MSATSERQIGLSYPVPSACEDTAQARPRDRANRGGSRPNWRVPAADDENQTRGNGQTRCAREACRPSVWREFGWRDIGEVGIGSDTQGPGTYPTITLRVAGQDGSRVTIDFLILSTGRGWYYVRDPQQLASIVKLLESRRDAARARG